MVPPPELEQVKDAFHPLQFVQLSHRIGCARPRSNMVHGVPYKLDALRGNAKGSEKTSCTVPVGETTDVVHVWKGFIGLMRQDEGPAASLCPCFGMPLPKSLVVAVCVNDEWDTSVDGFVKVFPPVKVGHHAQHLHTVKTGAYSPVSSDKDRVLLPVTLEVTGRYGRSNQHHLVRLFEASCQPLECLSPCTSRPAQCLRHRMTIARLA